MRFAPLALLFAVFLPLSCASSASRTEHGYGTVVIEYTTTPAPIQANVSFDFELSIEGVDLDDVIVTAVHPKTRVHLLAEPTMRNVSAGKWVAQDMLLHLPGEWEIAVDLYYNGRERHYTFPVSL
ncbi:MAG: hypothetical protein COA70_05650 [Planctomycetota bacterium]|nr:MAG: hypothetical protein COA70_05650 [Planctomycetota bacterium]